ncbi:hypothetical protein CU026_0702 [Enterococcus faecium]|nr:hypothetical protein [Enterococcus faecium]MBK4791893.1 hypothetical protein [Enterococcus faecium]MBK4802733.1 hypothetical protein [Enterococcus faecium]MBK4813900.1 hypothetical protein [Enterococcus faecium]MBK4815984.1 hypothetical protein [Enterococcus faecium]
MKFADRSSFNYPFSRTLSEKTFHLLRYANYTFFYSEKKHKITGF